MEKEKKIDISSWIDEGAAYSMEEQTPVDIRIAKIKDYLSNFDNINFHDDFYLEMLLDKEYKRIGVTNELDRSQLTSFQWPTFTSLLFSVEQKLQLEQKEKSGGARSYEVIINALNTIQKMKLESEFNQQTAITEDDFIAAEKNNQEIETELAFNNIKEHIRLFFLIIMATDKIKEFSSDDKKVKWRKSRCRKLCEVFSEEDAFESLEDEDGINVKRIIENEEIVIENENRINSAKVDLYKTFLNEFDLSSVKSIMDKRSTLLDRAKAIDPADVQFLEKCSAQILCKLMEICHNDDLSPYIKNLNSWLNFGIRIQVPEPVIYTLATAEMLYERYAKPEIAEQGFDYSSISALYYQAFENAYNGLIWKKYSLYLTDHTIGESKFTDILSSKHRSYWRGQLSQGEPGYGYLPSKESSWRYYADYDDNTGITSINATLMYKPFIIFLENNKMRQLPWFYDWFSKEVVGFQNRRDMFENIDFMRLFNQFREAMNAASVNRNNASHGGSEVSMNQCTEDRKTVLSDLQRTRESNIGLIFQLRDLVNFCH